MGVTQSQIKNPDTPEFRAITWPSYNKKWEKLKNLVTEYNVKGSNVEKSITCTLHDFGTIEYSYKYSSKQMSCSTTVTVKLLNYEIRAEKAREYSHPTETISINNKSLFSHELPEFIKKINAEFSAALFANKKQKAEEFDIGEVIQVLFNDENIKDFFQRSQ